jgi:hypothetical protein
LVNQSGGKGNETFDDECDRDIDKVSAQKICQRRTDASGKQSPYGTKYNAGKDDDGIARMDVSSGSGSRNTD